MKRFGSVIAGFHPGVVELSDDRLMALARTGDIGDRMTRSLSTDGGQSWTKLTIGLPASWTGKAQLAIAPTAPDTVYASIADSDVGRGLYKSTDGGDSWFQVNATDYQRYQGWYSHYVVVSPHDDQRLVPAALQVGQHHDRDERADVQRVRGRVEPDVSRQRRAEPGAEAVVGLLGDEAAFLEHVEQVGGVGGGHGWCVKF